MRQIFLMCLLVSSTLCFAGDELKKESDGFVWTLRMTTDSIASALDAKGVEIISADRGYRSILYIPEVKDKVLSIAPFFQVSYDSNLLQGACNTKGEEVVRLPNFQFTFSFYA